MAEFLLEVYLAATESGRLEEASACARASAEDLATEGSRIAFLHAIYVLEDETAFYVYEADAADTVREAAHRAHLTGGRVVAAVTQRKGVVQP